MFTCVEAIEGGTNRDSYRALYVRAKPCKQLVRSKSMSIDAQHFALLRCSRCKNTGGRSFSFILVTLQIEKRQKERKRFHYDIKYFSLVKKYNNTWLFSVIRNKISHRSSTHLILEVLR